jgi:flagellar hook assembly protein FlgD
VAIYNWILSTNPALAEGLVATDLVNVTNYPNPFRDKTNIVYGLTGNVVSKVEIKIYSQNGKLIREYGGPANTAASIGWNRVEWDGKDKNGRTVGNDVYFYTVKAEFGDGTKKSFKGKCVKVN